MTRIACAALLLAISLPATAQDQLGRLFFTPAERSNLDKLRRGETIAPGDVARADPVINGYIRRSDGVNTVWIDGAPYRTDAKRLANVDNLPVGSSARVEIRSGDAKAAELAPRKVKSKTRR
jgi:hypothetical protein